MRSLFQPCYSWWSVGTERISFTDWTIVDHPHTTPLEAPRESVCAGLHKSLSLLNWSICLCNCCTSGGTGTCTRIETSSDINVSRRLASRHLVDTNILLLDSRTLTITASALATRCLARSMMVLHDWIRSWRRHCLCRTGGRFQSCARTPCCILPHFCPPFSGEYALNPFRLFSHFSELQVHRWKIDDNHKPPTYWKCRSTSCVSGVSPWAPCNK